MSGFTIIEVMLFLAISGLLTIGILTTAGTAINVQRYKDATNSLVSYVQGEYDQVVNVQDNRPVAGNNTSNVTCTTSGFAPGTATLGSSLSCFIIGRLLTVSNNGTSIQAQSVFASKDGTGSDDIQALANSGLFTDAANSGEVPDTYAPEWSTRLVTTDHAASLDGWRLLIVRSPTSGTIRTFTSTMQSQSLTDMVTGNGGTTRQDMVACLDPAGLVTFQPSGVKILKDAASVSAIKPTDPGDCK